MLEKEPTNMDLDERERDKRSDKTGIVSRKTSEEERVGPLLMLKP